MTDDERNIRILMMVAHLKHQLAHQEPIDLQELAELTDMRRAFNK